MNELVVMYRKIKGQHVLTSPDAYGLYTASRDFNEAVSIAEEAISRLLKDNEGLTVKAEWDRSRAGSFEPLTEDTPDWSAPDAGQRLFFHLVGKG
jgi:hypothetical protein